MKGTMVVIQPDASVEVTELTEPVDLAPLRDAVGGYIETVPFFDTIMFRGELRPCVAFCDEDGKRKALALNEAATTLWDAALTRRPGFKDVPLGRWPSHPDYLVGSIVVVFGDKEWMAEL